MKYKNPRTLLAPEKIAEIHRVLNMRGRIEQVHPYVEALLGRSVYTHEMAHPEDFDEEIIRGYPADIKEIFQRYRRHWPDKPFIIGNMVAEMQTILQNDLKAVVVGSMEEAVALAEQGELRPILVDMSFLKME